MSSRPFVKWAGGKTKLVPEIKKRLPSFTGVYHEPFVGGGAVFLAIASLREGHAREGHAQLGRAIGPGTGFWAVLNDSNPELMNAYAVVKGSASKLEARLKELRAGHNKFAYYRIRAEEPTSALERAARMIYLNKTGFNGLYRVNGAGKFNVPIGSYKDPKVVESGVISDWERALEGAEICCGDFRTRIAAATRGDFIYVDPPYLPRSKTASFTAYTDARFGLKDHEDLAASLRTAGELGALFLCSQGDSETIRALYKDFRIESVSVTHAIAAKKSSRVKVGEVLISNFA